ncbi:MAG: hypothetical protein Q9226_002582 [Calogaya cf. arnoldii]
MSIPATLPPIHTSRYAYPNSRHDHYQPGPSSYDNTRNPPARLDPSWPPYNRSPLLQSSNRTAAPVAPSRQAHSPTTMASRNSTASQQPAREKRRPNWEEFYRHGIPDEVVYIDVTPDPPKAENRRPNHTTRTVARPIGTPEHAAKKRRTGQENTYDAHNFSYSNGRPNQPDDSGSGTISTDRTTSLNTTAPTSLGSHASHGSSGNYIDDQAIGQKRKRVTRGQVAADAQRKKEVEEVNDAYSSYVPPPKPPIKAKDVHVPAVRDVSKSPNLSE